MTQLNTSLYLSAYYTKGINFPSSNGPFGPPKRPIVLGKQPGNISLCLSTIAQLMDINCWSQSQSLVWRVTVEECALSLGLKSKDPMGSHFNLLVGQGEEQFFCPSKSTLVQTCLCLTPPFVCMASTLIFTHLKTNNPIYVYISICRKKSRPHSRQCRNTKTLHTGEKKKKCWLVPWLFTFPRESSPNFMGTKKLFESNLI